ncbi:hypothetical protein OA258_01830 [Pelagibacteraceae bacterium]|nr:hypothetical protein [Pelagibacteraceae bacterium]
MFQKLKSHLLWYRFGRVYTKNKYKEHTSSRFYSFSKFVNILEFNERKKYFEENKNLISNAKGYAIIPKDEISTDSYSKSLLEIKAKFNNMTWKKENYQKSFLMIEDMPYDHNIKNIVNILLPYITNYIGSLPVLLSAGMWFSPNDEDHPGRSQSWHFDIEDLKQLKVLIPLDDITLDNGPLTVIDAKTSNQILKKLFLTKKIKTKSEKLSDEIIKQHTKIETPLIANAGDVIFCDTANCYHYGSRKSSKPRKLLALHFSSAFCQDLPFLFRNLNKHNIYNDRKDALVYGISDYYLPKLRKKLKTNSRSAIKSILFN